MQVASVVRKLIYYSSIVLLCWLFYLLLIGEIHSNAPLGIPILFLAVIAIVIISSNQDSYIKLLLKNLKKKFQSHKESLKNNLEN